MVITTIRSNGFTAMLVRQALWEYFDIEITRNQHSPDGENVFVDLTLHPKGSLPVEKPQKRKRRKHMR